mmetsp:Transcript_14930/g.20920  ORF Transcript_14930/g.20920 Transcript_14930/m.20920 type:complete len:737 (-) Transcript_14930:125-2335(-)
MLKLLFLCALPSSCSSATIGSFGRTTACTRSTSSSSGGSISSSSGFPVFCSAISTNAGAVGARTNGYGTTRYANVYSPKSSTRGTRFTRVRRPSSWVTTTSSASPVMPPASAENYINDHIRDLQTSEKISQTRELSALERAQRSIKFWSNVLPVFAAYKAREVQLNALGKRARSGNSQEGDGDEEYDDIHEWGSERVFETIEELQGFYVKSGQVISTRVDLFPKQYTLKLMNLQDNLPPMSSEEALAVVREDLLDGRPLSELFLEFDPEPLGAASIAQVHRAVLLDGREVAVKIQRAGIQKKLRGDLANLKVFAKALNNVLPVDYFKVFSELEKVVENELDFLQEAQAARKVGAAVAHTVDGIPTTPALKVPSPIPGLASRRVMVMEFIRGTPLSRLNNTSVSQFSATSQDGKAGVAGGIKAKLREGMMKMVGKKLLSQLTEAYGRMIFGAGFIHGDPHPGNLMLQGLETGNPSLVLLDCGQFKQLSNKDRIKIAQLVMLTGQLSKKLVTSTDKQDIALRDEIYQDILTAAKDMGLELVPGSTKETAAALSLLLFGDPSVPLPGGYSPNELGSGSPLRAIANFPQHLVLLGRATVMIKGVAKKLNIPWALAEEWKSAAEHAVRCSSAITTQNSANLRGSGVAQIPCWTLDPERCIVPAPSLTSAFEPSSRPQKVKFRNVAASFSSSLRLLLTWVVASMASPLRLLLSRVQPSRGTKHRTGSEDLTTQTPSAATQLP